MNGRPRVLVIAGSDSSGGAGLVRDVQVLAELGVDAMCAVTAVTAQTDTRVDIIYPLPPELVHRQVAAALDVGGIGAIKIGMLGTRATVAAVANMLPSRASIPIVLDPVLASSSGSALIDGDGLIALRELLLPRSTVVTPNLLEAATLLGEAVAMTEALMIEQAARILRLGPQAVLIKGGHGAGAESIDILVTATAAPLRFRAERLKVQLRGTGCALSSAIAAALATGCALPAACERGKDHVLAQLVAAAGATLEEGNLRENTQ